MLRGFRAGALAAVLACATMLVAGPPRTAHAATSQILLPIHSFGRILVDPTTSQVFISGYDSIVVTDFTGNIVNTITGQQGAIAMAVVGNKLYVSEIKTGVVESFDTTSPFSDRGAAATGLTQPGDLAYAGGKLWTTTGACAGGAMKPVSIDLSAPIPNSTAYDNVFDATNNLQYCAKYGTNHAADPNFILAFSWGLSPATFDYMDVSGATPVITKTGPGGTTDLTVMPDEQHFLATNSAACPFSNTYCYSEFRLSDMATDNVSYGATRFPNSVDTTNANGAKIVGGIDGVAGQSNLEVVAYPIGDPSQLIASVATASWNTYYPKDRSVAISPDGLTAFVETESFNCYPYCEALNLVSLPALPPSGAPSAPTGATAFAGVGSAQVSWNAPTYYGKSPITGYTVQSSGGATAKVGPTTFNALLTGLSSVPHTFTVIATNVQGNSPPSAPSNSVTPLAGGTFRPQSPMRILDTRTRNGGFGRVGPGNTISLQVAGRGGVPATGWSAVAINVTVVNPSAVGFVTVYPSQSQRPTASSLNFTRGYTVPNLVQVAIGPDGKVNFYLAGASADLIADVEGWYGDSTDSYGQAGLYNPTGPGRIYDSRFISTANGDVHKPMTSGETRPLPISGYNWIPSGAAAVVLNITVTAPTRTGFLTVYPSGTNQPTASTVNFVPGRTVANRVIVQVGSDGNILVYNSAGTVDLIVDFAGWFTPQGPGPNNGSAFITGNPVRYFDSRTVANGKLGPGFYYWFQLTGGPISALSLNVAATNPTSYGFLTVYPDNGTHGQFPPPQTSDLNFAPGQTVANACIVDLNGVMAFNIFNPYGYTDVIVDIDGLYGPSTNGFAGAASSLRGFLEPRASPYLPSPGSQPKISRKASG